jgi:hypothetical protein
MHPPPPPPRLQYVTTIEWLKERLTAAGFGYRFISGSMPLKQRAKAIHAFQADPPTTGGWRGDGGGGGGGRARARATDRHLDRQLMLWAMHAPGGPAARGSCAFLCVPALPAPEFEQSLSARLGNQCPACLLGTQT